MRARINSLVRVAGTGSCLPDRVVDNEALSALVHGYDEAHSGPFPRWVDQVTHIHERRFCDPDTRTSDLALVAARQAMERAGVEVGDIDFIVYATFTPSQTLPGDHCLLAESLGAHETPTFQVMAACAGSVYGMGIAYGMIAAGVYRHVLVVGAETISKIVNFHDPVTAILFGDGAGAAVLSRGNGDEGKGMLPPYLGFQFGQRNIFLGNSNIPVDVSAYPERQVQAGVPLVEQALIEMEGGPSVLRHGVNQMVACTVRCLGYEPDDLKRGEPGLREALDRAWIVPHQANGRIVDGVADRLGVPPQRVMRTVYKYGNISAASNLVALDHGLHKGNVSRHLDAEGNVTEVRDEPDQRIREGDLVLLPSIGGGYLMGCVGFVV